MDNETRAAIEELINEDRIKAPVVAIDIRTRHPETGADISNHHECEGAIVLESNGKEIDKDGDIVLASSITIAGSFSKAVAERMTLNMINRLDEHFPGIKRSLSSTLALESIKSMGDIFASRANKDK